jgi:hypothetical protein
MFVVKTALIALTLATLFSGALMAIWGITDFFGSSMIHVVILVAALGVSSLFYLMRQR